jgi:hypothetical protein
MRFPACLLLIALAPIPAAAADDSESVRKSIPAIRAELPPILDGHLDDPVWRDAAVIDDLHIVVPNEFAEPSERSRIYVAYDDNFLYLAARFWDSEPITARVLRQGDLSYGEDGFSVILDPYDAGRSGYLFDVNPNGVRSDALFIDTIKENWDWEGIWQAAGARDAEGWSAEIAIPFKTLSFDPTTDRWGINFIRWLGRRNERFGWVSHNQKQNPAHMGELRGLAGREQGRGLDLVPGLRAGTSKDHATGDERTTFEPSLDAYWKITPSLTSALTLNPDFSGTTADARQINLTRFSLFFPEQRRFFLQDTDIFQFGSIDNGNGMPFFSRRVGLGGGGEPIRLDAGLKMTGRISGWDLGVLGVRQDSVTGPDSADLFVARVATNVFEESSLGGIFTSGNPNDSRSNSLAGLDFRYLNTRLSDSRTLSAAAWYQQTSTEGLDGDDAAYGVEIEMPNSTGWRGGVIARTFQTNFFPALGFANRTGIDFREVELGYTWQPTHGLVRSIASVIEAQRIDATDSDERSQYLNLTALDLENQKGDGVNLGVHLTEEALLEPFEISEGIFIPVGNYRFEHQCVNVITGQHRALAGEFSVCEGGFYDGNFFGAGGELSWRPSPHLRIGVGFDFNDIRLPAGNFDTRLVSLQADIAFTAKWYWENFFQYDNVSNTLGLNSILRFVPQAGRETVLVLNRQFEDFDRQDRFRALASDLTFKVSHTLRF